MLIFDEDKFEIKDHTSEREKYLINGRLTKEFVRDVMVKEFSKEPYKTNIFKISGYGSREDGFYEWVLNCIKTSLIFNEEDILDQYLPQYSLVAKESMELGHEDNKVRVEKGDVVLQGNRNVFYGSNNSYFENSYLGEIILNLAVEGTQINIENCTIVKSNEVDNTFSCIEIDAKLIGSITSNFKNSYVALGKNVFRNSSFNDYIRSRTILLEKISILDSNVSIQDIIPNDEHPGRFHSHQIILDNTSGIDNKNKTSNLFLFRGTNLNFKNVKTPSDIKLVFSKLYSNNAINSSFKIENLRIKKDEKIPTGKISFRSSNCEITDTNIGIKEKEVDFSVDNLYVKGPKTKNESTSNLIIGDSNHEGRIKITSEVLSVGLESKSTLNLYADKEIEYPNSSNLRIACGKGTSTKIKWDIFDNASYIDIVNDNKPNMVVDSDFLFGNNDKTMYIRNSSIKDSKLEIDETENGLSVINSEIEKSKVMISGDEIRANLKNTNLHLIDTLFDEGSCLEIRKKTQNETKYHIVRSSKFLIHSKLTVQESEGSLLYMDNCTLTGDNSVKDVDRLEGSYLSNSSLSNILRAIDCGIYNSALEDITDIFGSEFRKSKIKNTYDIIDQKIEGVDISYNVRGYVARGDTGLEKPKISDKLDRNISKDDYDIIDF